MFADEFERLIRRDPARRGLVSTEEQFEPLCPNHLANAAADLANNGRHIVIATGFYIPGASIPAAETDGPPGAALLAAALMNAGLSVQIVTDQPCQQAVLVAAQEMGLNDSVVVALPNDANQVDDWFYHCLRRANGPRWTHLIAIERVGPSHTSASIRSQLATADEEGLTQLREFEDSVPAEERDHCYNMRGRRLDDFTAPLHRLFESARSEGSIKTIGIGDGGNEIGMGSIAWRDLRQRLNSSESPRIPCRIATDWTIVCGVSNWGGMALAAATLGHLNRERIMMPWTSHQQHQALQRLVQDGPAVDGITGLCEPTVDGLPFLTYIQPWEGMRRIAGLGAKPSPGG